MPANALKYLDNDAALPLEALEFLRNAEIHAIAEEYLPLLKNPLKLSEKLSKKFNPQERRAVMHYLEILPKIRKKFCLQNIDLICDRLAYEQATAKDISEYKAKLWHSNAKILDLCCGMGGDSFWLPKGIAVSGVDIAPKRVLMFNENMERLGLPHRAILQNALEVSGGDFFCIDPVRREELSPSFKNILELSKKFNGGMIKLPPAFPENEIPKESDIMYLGNENDCRECLMLNGIFGKETIRAVAISKNETFEWQCKKSELQNISLEVKKLGGFILEPYPVLVRSHLFLSEAKKYGFWQIDRTLAYVSCENLLQKHSGFTAYNVVEQSSLSTSNVKAMLKKHDIGKITLKKRGVEVVPETEIRRLAPKGEKEGVLFYTRILGEKRAILAEA
jgi:SAM-dependent methyltransferase